MIDHKERLGRVFTAEVARIQGSDTVGVAVNGPCYVPSDEGITVGWVILVSLKHDSLLDRPDLGVAIPIKGVLPPDGVFREAAVIALEKAREARSESERAAQC